MLIYATSLLKLANAFKCLVNSLDFSEPYDANQGRSKNETADAFFSITRCEAHLYVHVY